MPPKKRKAASAAESKMAAQLPVKRVRIAETSTIGSESRASTPAPGRPRRVASNDTPQYTFTRKNANSTANTANTTGVPVQTNGNPAPKRRGQTPKNSLDQEETKTAHPSRSILKKSSISQSSATASASLPPRSRGRPLRARNGSPQATQITAPVTPTVVAKKRLGRKPKSEVEKSEMEDVESETDYVDGATNLANGDSKIDENVQYWLMKAEPESRMEKGVDVKFSIDDLAARTEPEGWDGVRNPVARNNMRAMRVGDLAFFYHSNCTTPGIVGIMRIVEEHQVDETAFDPTHPYYDPKSTRDKPPKWELVKVEFVKKFDTMMTLKELKSFASPGGMLEKLQTLKQSRLSVSSVQPAESQFILEQLGERYDLGHVIGDGYESDTDGETEQAGQGLDDDVGSKTSVESDDTANGLNENESVASINHGGIIIDSYNGTGTEEVDQVDAGSVSRLPEGSEAAVIEGQV